MTAVLHVRIRCWPLLLFLWAIPAHAQQITLAVDDIVSPSFRARNISAELKGADLSHFEARIGELSLAGKTWRNVRLQCADARLEPSVIQCVRGALNTGEVIPLNFRYDMAGKNLALNLTPSTGEAWRIAAQFGKSGRSASLSVINGKAVRLADFLPQDSVKPTRGMVSGSVKLAGDAGEMRSISAALKMSALDFSDAGGLHAGEKIAGELRIDATRPQDNWTWRGTLDWQSGEMFWQPLYFSGGGHHLEAQGVYSAQSLRVDQGKLRIAQVGAAAISGTWDRAGNRLADFDLHAANLDASGLYRILLKPFLEKTAFAKLRLQGKAGLDWRYRSGTTEEFDLTLHEVSVEDEARNFALNGVNAHIPWAAQGKREADIRLQGGQLMRVPFGAVDTSVQMEGMRFNMAQLAVPVLDGSLRLEDFSAEKQGDAWQWRFGGGLSPVSMAQLSEALQLPVMHGALSGVIPKVTYAQQRLDVEGALLIKVFDGTVVVKNLSMLNVSGPAPRIMANLDMRNLDLELLTRTFSFGSMQGRIDMQVDNLELSRWRPVAFDADIRSSAGDYPRKISQRAVQNITALAGVGAMAALQRSYLNFFEQFGYDKLGLSCHLRNGLCYMDGMEPAPHGYVIVKGGGIPAITVLGYNHNVSWQELLERLARITQSNTKAVVH